MTKKEEPTATTETRNLILSENFWLDSSSRVRRHTLLGENPARTRRLDSEAEEENPSPAARVSESKPST